MKYPERNIKHLLVGEVDWAHWIQKGLRPGRISTLFTDIGGVRSRLREIQKRVRARRANRWLMRRPK